MSSKKGICAICGKEYDLCYTCESRKINSYKTVVDTKEHFEIFTILHQYGLGYLAKAEAKIKLSNHDLTEEFVPSVKAQIEEIMKEEVVKKTAAKGKKRNTVKTVEKEVSEDTEEIATEDAVEGK